MRLTVEETKQLDASLANLKRCLVDELNRVPSVRDDKAKVDHKLLKDDKFLATISDTYLSNTEGIINLLVVSGLLSKIACPCVAHCTMSTR